MVLYLRKLVHKLLAEVGQGIGELCRQHTQKLLFFPSSDGQADSSALQIKMDFFYSRKATVEGPTR